MYKISTTTRKLRLLNNRIMENTRKYRYIRGIASLLFGCAICLFWGLYYPHHLHYHEQFQLFLFTPEYGIDKCLHPGGIAEYIAVPDAVLLFRLGRGYDLGDRSRAYPTANKLAGPTNGGFRLLVSVQLSPLYPALGIFM